MWESRKNRVPGPDHACYPLIVTLGKLLLEQKQARAPSSSAARSPVFLSRTGIFWAARGSLATLQVFPELFREPILARHLRHSRLGAGICGRSRRRIPGHQLFARNGMYRKACPSMLRCHPLASLAFRLARRQALWQCPPARSRSSSASPFGVRDSPPRCARQLP